MFMRHQINWNNKKEQTGAEMYLYELNTYFQIFDIVGFSI